MEDFTKPFKQELSTTSVATKSTDPKIDLATTPKKGFIEARKNKDNFWNLMFAVGITLGFTLAGITNLAILLGITLVVVSYVVKKGCKITFTDEKRFINCEGEDITERTPQTLFWIILFIVSLIGLSAYLHIPLLTFFSICFGPALYFILINCPISILFNYQFWKQNARSSKRNGMHWTQDPLQYYVAGNIYYNNHNSYHLNKHK